MGSFFQYVEAKKKTRFPTMDTKSLLLYLNYNRGRLGLDGAPVADEDKPKLGSPDWHTAAQFAKELEEELEARGIDISPEATKTQLKALM
jgi:hypothetical protein